jgi:DNA primase
MYIESKFDNIFEKYDLNDPHETIRAIDEVCEEIAKINSKIEREVYGGKIADKFKISSEAILNKINGQLNLRLKKEKKDLIETDMRKLMGYGDRINPDFIKNPKVAKIEEVILGQLLNYPEEYKNIKEKINEDLFFSEFHKKIFSLFKEAVQSGGSFDTALVTKDLSEDETSRVTGMMVNNQKNNLVNLLERLAEQSLISARKNINIKEVAASEDDWINYIRDKHKSKEGEK